MNKLLPFLMFASGVNLPGIEDKPKGVDIEAEYKLIKQKKSKLSRRMRNMVVCLYERETG